MNDTITKMIRAGLGVVIVVALAVVVNSWWGDYRTASADAMRSKPSTSTAAADAKAEDTKKADDKQADEKTDAKKKKKSEKQVIVLEDGVNFRERPSQGGNVIRTLDKDERLTWLAEEGAWYNVEDDKGTKGWVTSNTLYTKVK